MASSASPFITLLSRFKLVAVFRRDTKSKLRIKSISFERFWGSAINLPSSI